jgi:hypothetical protein
MRNGSFDLKGAGQTSKARELGKVGFKASPTRKVNAMKCVAKAIAQLEKIQPDDRDVARRAVYDWMLGDSLRNG